MAALEFGFCGVCPTASPSSSPSIRPTQQPSLVPTTRPTLAPTSSVPTLRPSTGRPTTSPTGFLDSCPVEPPTCTEPDDGQDRVIFCIQLGALLSEECVLVEDVQTLLDLGEQRATGIAKTHRTDRSSLVLFILNRCWSMWALSQYPDIDANGGSGNTSAH